MREKEKPKITPRLLLERDGAATLLSKPAGGVRDALKGLSLLTAWPGTVRRGHYLTYQDLRFKKNPQLS